MTKGQIFRRKVRKSISKFIAMKAEDGEKLADGKGC